jgi:alpha-mannosidase
VLGKFITLSDYFSETDRPGDLTRFKADQYRVPYLKQAIIREQPDPLSRCVDWHARRAVVEAGQAMELFEQLAAGRQPLSAAEPSAAGAVDSAPETPLVELARQRDAAAAKLAATLTGAKAGSAPGYTVVNSSSFSRRAGIDVSGLALLPDVQGPVLAAQQQGERKLAVVEVPACGLAWIAAGSQPAKRAAKPLAEASVLRNEFFELNVHPASGGIRSIYVPGQRGNRLSQQLGFRLPTPRPKPGDVWRDPDEEAPYTRMVADKVEVTAAGPAFGEITSRGQLLDPQDQPLATFVERLQVWRGVRIIGLEIELDVREEPRADPWNSYYAIRFAWSNEAAELFRSVGGVMQPSANRRIEAPQFIEIRDDRLRTTIFTGGLPYHRFNGERMLDTLLVVRDESRRIFRLGIGIDVQHPAAAASELHDPLSVVAATPLPAAASGSSWMFHLDVRNVVATHWDHAGGAAGGFRVRLQETEGRAGRVYLRSFRPPRVARQLDFQGNTQAELAIDGDRIAIDLAAYEWIQVLAEWQP